MFSLRPKNKLEIVPFQYLWTIRALVSMHMPGGQHCLVTRRQLFCANPTEIQAKNCQANAFVGHIFAAFIVPSAHMRIIGK